MLSAKVSQKRKLSSYTLAKKYEVLQLLDKGQKASQIARDLGIPKNNISTWSKPETKQKILMEYESGITDSKRKRFRQGKYADIEDALLQWFKDVRSRPDPVPIDGKTLKIQAEK